MHDDGYLRLTVEQLQNIRLIHLISGLDEWTPAGATCAAQRTDITGYTEWVSDGDPAITLGWDWHLQAGNAPSGLLALAGCRSNIMMQDSMHNDLGQRDTGLLLDTYISTFNWQSETLSYIKERYRSTW